MEFRPRRHGDSVVGNEGIESLHLNTEITEVKEDTEKSMFFLRLSSVLKSTFSTVSNR